MDSNTAWRGNGESVMIRVRWWPVLVVGTLLGMAWCVGAITSIAVADEAVGEGASQLTFQQPTTSEDTVSLVVRLTDAEGQPIARAQVEFSVSPDFFGDRPVSLQTAITNADGLATLRYVPTWDGAHRMTGHFAGNADFQPGEATIVMTVSGAADGEVPLAQGGASLGVVRLWAAPAVTLGAAIVWLLIVGVLVRVGWGVWRERDLGESAIALPGTAVEESPGDSGR